MLRTYIVLLMPGNFFIEKIICEANDFDFKYIILFFSILSKLHIISHLNIFNYIYIIHIVFNLRKKEIIY